MRNTFIHCGTNQLYEISYQHEEYAVVKDVRRGNYLRVSGRVFQFLNNCTDAESGRLCTELFSKVPPSSKKAFFLTKRVLEHRIPSWLVPSTLSFLFSSPLLMAVVIVLSLAFACTLHWENNISLLRGTSLIWIILNIIFHEMGHVLACIQAGREVGSVGIKLNYGLPMFFVDTRDICMAPRRGRIATSLGGVYANSLLLFGLFAVELAIQRSCMVLMGISLSFIISNLIPFARLDGYYLLSDLLGSSNLSHDSRRALKNWLKTQHTPQRPAYIIYGLLRLIFISIIIFEIFLNLSRYV